jgi:hypothetical protein
MPAEKSVEESRVIDKPSAGIEWARIERSFIIIRNIVLPATVMRLVPNSNEHCPYLTAFLFWPKATFAYNFPYHSVIMTRNSSGQSKVFSVTKKSLRQKRDRRKMSLEKKSHEYSNKCGADVCLGIRIRESGKIFIFSADISGFWSFIGPHPLPKGNLGTIRPPTLAGSTLCMTGGIGIWNVRML